MGTETKANTTSTEEKCRFYQTWSSDSALNLKSFSIIATSSKRILDFEEELNIDYDSFQDFTGR